MSGGVGGGGGFGALGARLQQLVKQGQDALGKLTGKTKEGGETKDVKGDAKAGASSGSAGAGGVKAKGKAKGKDLGAIGGLIAGADNFSVEDEDRERRRRSRQFTGDSSSSNEFFEQDGSTDKSAVAHISAEYRGQVASGMVQGRSFTAGSCLVPDQVPEDQDDDDVTDLRATKSAKQPVNRRR